MLGHVRRPGGGYLRRDPVIPIIFSPLSSGGNPALYLRLPGGVREYTTSSTSSVEVTATYYNPGVNIYEIETLVRKGVTTTAWDGNFMSATASTSTVATFSSSSAGWDGAGVYYFTANAYSADGAHPVVASATADIVLTLT